MPSIWKTVAGWDPGASGALCFLHLDRSGHVMSSDDLRFSRASLLDIVEALQEFGPALALLERVNSYGQGRTSAFKFGAAYGVAQASLTATRTPFELITPQKWQSRFSIPKTNSQTAHKRELRNAAQRVFPERHIVLENADAYLIAEVARRVYLSRTRGVE